MPRLDETVYQQLKAAPTERELRELDTSTLDACLLAQQHVTGRPTLVAFLALLKPFHRLKSQQGSPPIRCWYPGEEER